MIDLTTMEADIHAFRDRLMLAGRQVRYCMFTIDAGPLGERGPMLWVQLRGRDGEPVDHRFTGDTWEVITLQMDAFAASTEARHAA